MIHKIPVAAILSAFLIQSKISRIKVALFLVLFAFMTPLGSWISANFEIADPITTYMSAIVIGILLHVSTTIIFEASKNHTFNASKLGVIVAGIILAYLM